MFIREWGEGNKIARLIHGLASTSASWEETAQDLIADGYKVLAPDLHGHGLSGRLPRYTVQRWANAISSHIPQADLIVGHSIGALIATKLHTAMQPSYTILIDPVFRLPPKIILAITQNVFKRNILATGKKSNPKSSESVRNSVKLWDPKTVYALEVSSHEVKKFLAHTKNTLITRHQKSYIAPLNLFQESPRYTIITIPNAGHDIHHDNYPAWKEKVYNFLNPITV